MAGTRKRAAAARVEKLRAQARDRQRRKRSRDRSSLARAAADVPASAKKNSTPDERRVASRGKRDRFSARTWGGRLSNSDPTLIKFASRDGIGLYTRILHQFANVAGYCQAWCDHVLVTDRAIKPAVVTDDEGGEKQKLADAAADRARKAWARVANQTITMQRLLMGRFYGFSRAEKVAQFDDIIREWIPVLFDVPQESWLFDDDGRDFLVTSDTPNGIEVDCAKFIHFQWGSADTKYGKGDLSYVYLSLWKIQKLETMALQRIEDNESTVIVHIPTNITGPERDDLENAYADEFRKVITVPAPNEQIVRTEMPTLSVTSAGVTGRQEYDAIRFHERWVQTMLLGAPQTGDKSLGTGKLEDTRKAIWDDKTPLGSLALDQTLNAGWMATYCDWNLADLPPELRPRFESDSTSIVEGLAGAQARTYLEICTALAAKLITSIAAEEGFAAIGIPRAKAKAIADSIVSERDSLEPVPQPVPPAVPTGDDEAREDGEDEGADDVLAFATEDGRMMHVQRRALVLTDRGEIPAELIGAAAGAEIVTRRVAKEE